MSTTHTVTRASTTRNATQMNASRNCCLIKNNPLPRRATAGGQMNLLLPRSNRRTMAAERWGVNLTNQSRPGRNHRGNSTRRLDALDEEPLRTHLGRVIGSHGSWRTRRDHRERRRIWFGPRRSLLPPRAQGRRLALRDLRAVLARAEATPVPPAGLGLRLFRSPVAD